MLARSVIMVTDSTRTVRDIYIFDLNWWPFGRDGAGILVRPKPVASDRLPRDIGADRSHQLADGSA